MNYGLSPIDPCPRFRLVVAHLRDDQRTAPADATSHSTAGAR